MFNTSTLGYAGRNSGFTMKKNRLSSNSTSRDSRSITCVASSPTVNTRTLTDDPFCCAKMDRNSIGPS